jgi:hypothetical protein
MCEGDATSAFERGPFNHDEFSEATDALVAAREEHPTHEFYLVAEIDAWNREREGVEMSDPHTHETPNASLPPLGDGPRRKILVTVEVPANWESRMDMQWVLEREIHADRWSWTWPKE